MNVSENPTLDRTLNNWEDYLSYSCTEIQLEVDGEEFASPPLFEGSWVDGQTARVMFYYSGTNTQTSRPTDTLLLEGLREERSTSS